MYEESEVNLLQQTITIKCKLKLQSSLDESVLTKSLEQYRRACNAVSQYMFDHSFEMAQAKLNKALYRQLRNDYGLKAQMAQSAIRNVVARYRTVKTQLAQKPYRGQTRSIRQRYLEKRDPYPGLVMASYQFQTSSTGLATQS